MTSSVQLEVLGSVPEVVSKKDLQSALTVTLAQSKQSITGHINCIFVSRQASRALNAQFASNDYPTDVLSFNYFEGESLERTKDTTLAEIAICSEIAKTQAKQHDNTYADELILLLVHGLLHILGYDHTTTQDQTSFELLQGGIMEKLNRKNREFQWSV